MEEAVPARRFRRYVSAPATKAEKDAIHVNADFHQILEERRCYMRRSKRIAAMSSSHVEEPPIPKRQKSLTAQERTTRGRANSGGKSLKTIAQGAVTTSGAPEPLQVAWEETHQALLDERSPSTRQTDGFMHRKVPREETSKSFSRGCQPAGGKIRSCM